MFDFGLSAAAAKRRAHRLIGKQHQPALPERATDGRTTSGTWRMFAMAFADCFFFLFVCCGSDALFEFFFDRSPPPPPYTFFFSCRPSSRVHELRIRCRILTSATALRHASLAWDGPARHPVRISTQKKIEFRNFKQKPK